MLLEIYHSDSLPASKKPSQKSLAATRGKRSFGRNTVTPAADIPPCERQAPFTATNPAPLQASGPRRLSHSCTAAVPCRADSELSPKIFDEFYELALSRSRHEDMSVQDHHHYLLFVLYVLDIPCYSLIASTQEWFHALSAAAQFNDIDNVRKALKRNRAKAKIKDDYGYTPLHYAAQSGALEARIPCVLVRRIIYLTDLFSP